MARQKIVERQGYLAQAQCESTKDSLTKVWRSTTVKLDKEIRKVRKPHPHLI